MPGVPTTDTRGEAGGTRTVVESDIWQIDGNTVYFFNSTRGFQVIDLTVVDQPVLKGTLSFAAQGEQMYLLPGGTPEDRWLALLTASACDSRAGEVILCGGAINTPQLLQLSGVGNAEWLRPLGLDVVTDLCDRLLAGGAPGLHFYTLNQAALTTTIWQRLGL